VRGEASTIGQLPFGGEYANARGREFPPYTNRIAMPIGGGLDYHGRNRLSLLAIQVEYQQTRLRYLGHMGSRSGKIQPKPTYSN
jgi:hypothetical protein